jgi:hypothetical protein
MILNELEEPEVDVGLADYCMRELNNSKKISKSDLDKILGYLIKTIKDTNDKQKLLELKVEHLGKQNEEFIIQNQQMLQEILNKK